MTHLEKKLLFASLLALTLSISFLYADEEEKEKPKEHLLDKKFISKDKIEMRDNLWDGVTKEGFLKVRGGELYTLKHGAYSGYYRVGPSVCFADVTEDGKPDLVVGGEGGFIWYFDQTSKNGTYPPKFSIGKFLHGQYSKWSLLHVDVQDFEDDGKPDIVYTSENGEIYVIRALGNGYFKSSAPTLVFNKEPYRGRGFTPRFYDWDNDGNFDLYMGDASYSANAVYFFKNWGSKANPHFKPEDDRQWLAYGYGREMLDPCHGDLNGDGKMDILIADSEGKLLMYCSPEQADPENPRLLNFVGELTVNGSSTPVGEGARCYLYDIDRDGLLDLLLSDIEGYFYVARNIGVKARPAFGPTTQLKGKDTYKPYKALAGWKEEQLWDRNAAPVADLKSETVIVDRMSGQTALIDYVHITYADGYIGGTGGLCKSHLKLYDGKNYRVSFKARGRGGKGRIRFEQDWEDEIRGDTLHQTKNDRSEEFSISEDFADLSFVHHAEHSSKTIKSDTINMALHFYLDGQATNCFLDIYDVTMTREN
jgi:hypothetical protein